MPDTAGTWMWPADGKIVGTFPEKELVPALLRELDIIAAEDNAQKLAS